MSELKMPHLLIGYWVRKGDEVLTARIDEAQRANGLSRADDQEPHRKGRLTRLRGRPLGAERNPAPSGRQRKGAGRLRSPNYRCIVLALSQRLSPA